jgi:dienelactone hydrolase
MKATNKSVTNTVPWYPKEIADQKLIKRDPHKELDTDLHRKDAWYYDPPRPTAKKR